MILNSCFYIYRFSSGMHIRLGLFVYGLISKEDTHQAGVLYVASFKKGNSGHGVKRLAIWCAFYSWINNIHVHYRRCM